MLHHKVLIDVGSGVHFTSAGRELGADVRVVLPGDGCLLCLGGLARFQDAVVQASFGAVRPREGVDFRTERAGSMRSLALVAAGTALRLLEDLVVERIERSTWVRLDWNDAGLLTSKTAEASPDPACQLCRWAGLGHLQPS